MEVLKILIVDDELGMRLGVQRALQDYQIKLDEPDCTITLDVSQAETGEQALELIEQDPPAILLLDHKLPGMTGIEVLEKISENPAYADILTIMITAYASIENAVRATKIGAYDFLPKPFTPNELKYTIDKAAARVMLTRQAKDLEAAKKRIRFEFIRVLGHELKAPLGAVENYLELMNSRILGDNINDYDSPIKRSQIRLAQMRKLILDLLDMTRIESGQTVRDLHDINLLEVAKSAIELVEPQAQERNISITLNCPQDLTIFADQREMEMIFNNLISNAVKYNRDKGSVTVTVSQEANRIELTVSDTGIGMTEAECEKLFSEFVRIKNAKTRNILGSGLGLSIIKRLAEVYNGNVAVTSQPDVGTTFSLTLLPDENSTQNIEK